MKWQPFDKGSDMKSLNNTEQSGRSMVEILGVLAIIGVLSVGGISGYSKAMAKYKLTKAQDQMSMLLVNLRSAFAGSSNFQGLDNKKAIDLNIVPAEMLPKGLGATDDNIINAFSGKVVVAATASNKHFTIEFGGLGKESCTSLASSDWGTEGLVSMQINAYPVKEQVSLPIKAIDAITQCDQNNSANKIVWEYY